MAALVFGMNQSLDGYVDHMAFAPSPTLLRHFIEEPQRQAAVGSTTNATPETDTRRAAINEYNPDGSGHRVFAAGLRNPVGLAYFPAATRYSK